MSPSQTLVDYRGYFFQFPTLGLPNRSGEFLKPKMVIATKDVKDVNGLFWKPTDAPLRYAPKDCASVQVEYEGSVWILPLVPPQKSYPETEIFSVQCRRELLTSMPSCDTRIKVEDGGLLFSLVHPNGMAGFQTNNEGQRFMASTPATEAEEKIFWQNTLSSLFSGYASNGSINQFGSLYQALPSAAERSKLNNKVAAEDLLDWPETPENAFDREWMKEKIQSAAEHAEGTKTPMSAKGPGFALKALARDGGVRFERAIVFDDVDEPSWHEWKEVPPHAFKPGKALLFSKQAKDVWAKKGTKEVQWKTHRMGASVGSKARKS